jgi:hypothetical protein
MRKCLIYLSIGITGEPKKSLISISHVVSYVNVKYLFKNPRLTKCNTIFRKEI